MRETVQEPGISGSKSSRTRVDGRVHQLLNLAAALVRSAASSSTTSASAASPASADSDSTDSTNRPSEVFVGTPLGMDVGSFTDAECLDWAHHIESLGHYVQALQVHIAGEIGRRKDAGRYDALGARKPVELLVQSLHLSAGEAARRIRLAKAATPGVDAFTGEILPAAHPDLGAAFCSGALSQESALIVNGFLDDANRLLKDERISGDIFQDITDLMIQAGRNEVPDHIRRIGTRIMAHVDPDGQKPSTRDLIAKQGLFFRQARRGLVHFDGHMTIAQYEQLMVAIGIASNPNQHTDISIINQPGATAGSGSEAASHTERDADADEGGSGVAEQASFLDQIGEIIKNFSAAEQDRGSSGQGGAQDTAQPCPDQSPLGQDCPTGGGSDGPDDATTERKSGPVPVTGPDSGLNSESSSDTASAGSNEDSWSAGWDGWTEEPVDKQVDRPPAMLNGVLVSWGGQRRLKDWEIPPRPHEAPAYATAPQFEGDSWFWLPQVPPQDTGAGAGTGTDPPGGEPWPVSEPESDPWTIPGQDQTAEDEEWVVDGIRIPHPGSGEVLAGLDSRDPASTDYITQDERTYGQKLLDGLLDCVKLAARTGALPINGGLKTQLIVTTTQADLDRTDGAGTIFTGRSGPVALGLFDQELCDPQITRVLMGEGQTILDVGRTQRLFTFAQRKLLYARDLGCTFPDCTAPAAWCEGHHVIPWQDGGATSIANGALLCSHHHSLIHNSEWTMSMIDGTPYFVAPYALDHTQTPRRNKYHRGLQ